VNGESGGPWLWVHLSFVFSGLTIFAIAVSCAALYLFQSNQLKSHRPGPFFLGLPSLDVLDRIHTYSLVTGVVLFSSGLLSGLFFAESKNKVPLLAKDPTVTLSVTACILYWAIVAVRLSSLSRGRKIAISTLGVFAILTLAVLNAHTLVWKLRS
jgi:ABC-type uncharacterized transport system permease subunit